MQNQQQLQSPRVRTAFTEEQINELEKEFERWVYIPSKRRLEMSKQLGLTQKHIKLWFQNRRMKVKKTIIIPNGNKIMKSGRIDHKVMMQRMYKNKHTENINPAAEENEKIPVHQTYEHLDLKPRILSVETIVPPLKITFRNPDSQNNLQPNQNYQQCDIFKQFQNISMKFNSMQKLQDNEKAQNSQVLNQCQNSSTHHLQSNGQDSKLTNNQHDDEETSFNINEFLCFKNSKQQTSTKNPLEPTTGELLGLLDEMNYQENQILNEINDLPKSDILLNASEIEKHL